MYQLHFPILLLCILSVISSVIEAQTPLDYGESAMGLIGVQGEEDAYSFCGKSGDYVIIRLNSEDFSFTRVELYDSGGTQLAAASSVIVARIEFELPANDEYTILAMSTTGNEVGAYSITLSVLNPPGATQLNFSTAFNATLDFTTAMDAYTIGLSAGSHVQFFLNTDDMDFPRIELFDESGNLIASDFSVLTVQINEFVPTDGCYTLYVMSQNGDESGNYSLSFLLVSGSFTNDCTPRLPCNINAPNTATINIGENNGLSGDTLAIPVTIQDCENIASIQGSLGFGNPAMVEVLDLIPGIITPIFNLNNNTFSFFDQEGGQSVVDNDTLFYILIVVNGTPGDSSQIMLRDTPLFVQLGCIIGGQPSIVDIELNDGLVFIRNNVTISGIIRTCEQEPVNLAEVLLSGTDPAGNALNMNVMTGPDGLYQFEDIPAGSSITITPSKDINPTNGLSAFGLFQGQQFILSVSVPEIYSPYQVVAGNANCNNSFSTIDLLVIQRVMVGINDNFESCPSWQFVPATHTFSLPFSVTNVFPFPNEAEISPVIDNTTIDFIGLKTGDILKDANPQNLMEVETDGNNVGELGLVYDLPAVHAGDIIEVPFYLAKTQSLASLQMALSFDSEKLQWIGLLPDHDEMAFMMVGHNETEQNLLKFSWFSHSGQAVTFAKDQLLFYLSFEVLEDLEISSIPFFIDSNRMEPVARKESGYPFVLHLEKEILNSTNPTVASGFRLGQNIPNPSWGQTIIPFDTPNSQEIMLHIFDQSGRTIHQMQRRFPTGQNAFTINTNGWHTGIYYYRLSTRGFTETKPMMVERR